MRTTLADIKVTLANVAVCLGVEDGGYVEGVKYTLGLRRSPLGGFYHLEFIPDRGEPKNWALNKHGKMIFLDSTGEKLKDLELYLRGIIKGSQTFTNDTYGDADSFELKVNWG